LVITAPLVFGRLHVLPIIIDFLKAYPEIDIRLASVDRVMNLIEEQIDIAVRIGELPDSSLIATKVGTIRRVVCASPDYLRARGTPMHPKDLEEQDCITYENRMSPQEWKFRVGKRDRPFAVHSRLTVNTAEAAIAAATAGIGITRVLAYQIAEAWHSGGLSVVLDDFEPQPEPVNLVHTIRAPLPLKVRAFLDYAAPRLKASIRAIAA
jgi:DNA-binding transcriptional LysR family regulator